jgi:glycosyltransferase involved in cell wall biosynthesis
VEEVGSSRKQTSMNATEEMLSTVEANAKESGCSGWPRIALVTPVRNSAKYIEQTIRSVLAQGYPNLDYFVVDGGSTDGTVEIIRKYEKEISGWISEPDKGMYDAINKGFARTSGEIMGWISATDMLHIGGLSVVGSVFGTFSEVEWIMGRPTTFNGGGMTVEVLGHTRWSRYRFLTDANVFIQQESTFWRRSLWEKAGGYADASRRLASDFELWVRFFRHAKLYPVDALIGGYRVHEASLGLEEMEECLRIHEEIIKEELDSLPRGRALRLFRTLGIRMRRIRGLRYGWWRLVECPLYRWRAPRWPPVIRHDSDRGWVFQP